MPTKVIRNPGGRERPRDAPWYTLYPRRWWSRSAGAVDRRWRTFRTDREARKRIDAWVQAGGQPIRLEIDGGVKVDNIGAIHAAGADTFVAGSAVFGAPNYREVISAMRGEIQKARGTAA